MIHWSYTLFFPSHQTCPLGREQFMFLGEPRQDAVEKFHAALEEGDEVEKAGRSTTRTDPHVFLFSFLSGRDYIEG